MAYVCPHCGMYSQNHVDREQNMNCEYCERKTPTKILPLFVVTGTSGAGKTSVPPELVKQLPECVVFDKDLLLGYAAHGLEQFYDAWLLIAHSIAQGGRHTVICGTIMPWDLDNCPNRDLVGTVHFLNLHCNDEVREQRLRARPAWRKSSSDEVIEEHRQFARWLLENAATKYEPPMPTVDTSAISIEEAARQIAQWVRSVIE